MKYVSERQIIDGDTFEKEKKITIILGTAILPKFNDL